MQYPRYQIGNPLFFILNAGSGHADKTAVRETLEQMMEGAGRNHHLCLVESASTLTGVARDAVARALSCDGAVVVLGGDGTLNAVADVALAQGCPVGLLPTGTFNYFGRTHDIPENIEDAIRDLLLAEPRPVQVGLLNNRVFLVNASLGLYPQVLQDREAWKQRYGRRRLVAVWSGVVSVLRGARQLRIQLERQGERVLLRTPTLFVGNNRLQLERAGIHEVEKMDDHQLVAVVVKPVATPAMLWLLLCGAFGRLGEADQVDSFGFQSLTVTPSAIVAGRRVKVAMDGEVSWMAAPLTFRVSPRPLYLLKTPHGRQQGEPA
ncbi:MAG: diacylglycerol kinase family protein [Porticoccaceae bacterium]